MAWVSGYSHRLSCPVANPSTEGDRALDAIPLPTDILLSLGHIAETDFSDVLIATDPGEVYDSGSGVMKWRVDDSHVLPSVTVAGFVYCDWDTMPAGRDVLYAFIGKSGADAPAALGFYTAARETAGVV